MGRQSEIVLCVTAAQARNLLCAAGKSFNERRLVHLLAFCAAFESGQPCIIATVELIEIGFDSEMERRSNTFIAIDTCGAVVLSKIVSRKLNDGS